MLLRTYHTYCTYLTYNTFFPLRYTSAMQARSVTTGLLLAAVLLAVGAADFWWKEYPRALSIAATTGAGSGGNASSRSAVRKGVATPQQVDVTEAITSLGFTEEPAREQSFLEAAATADQEVKTSVLLHGGDRAVLFAWIESPGVKDTFSTLKRGLQQTFSPQLTGLVDVTAQEGSGPVVNTLSFTDPAISPEKLIFLRVRTRLYEFHIAEGAEDEVAGLIEELVR